MRILLPLLLIILLPIGLALEECKSPTPTIDIPCRVTMWYPLASGCATYSAIIWNDTGHNITYLPLEDFGGSGLCSFNFTENRTGSYPFNVSNGDTGVVLVENNRMWLIAILLIPLGIAFMFLYWANTLQDKEEVIKWFLRMLSFLMLFVTFAGANIVINLNPGFEGLQSLYNFYWIGWLFWLMIALFLVFFIVKIISSIREKKEDDLKMGRF